MERFSIKLLFFLSLFLLKSSLETLRASGLLEIYDRMEALPHRSEANKGELELLNILYTFFTENDIQAYTLAYSPSSLVQSFSHGLYVKISGSSSEKSAFFVFPLDQKKNSPSTTNNVGIYTALEAILNLKNREGSSERTLYFVFLGAELTREIPIGSLFLLQNSALNFKNSLFYYFEVSNLTSWKIYTRGEKAYYVTPEEQLKNFLKSLYLIPSLKFEVMDSFPLKNIFQEHDKEPFETYSTLNFPFLKVSTDSSRKSLTNLNDKLDLSSIAWADFYSRLAQISTDSELKTNQYYLYFHFGEWFALIDSSYYLISIILLANFITFAGFRQIRLLSERIAQTLQFAWYFVFLLFLFFLSLISTSYLFPFLTSYTFKPYLNPSWLLFYLKVSFSSFLSFSFLYLAHPTLGFLPKQSYLYIALFTFLVLTGLAAFYNIVSSFFFLVSAILAFLGITTRRGVRLFFNILTFLWLLFVLREGVDTSWLSFFLREETNINLLLSASLFPYFLLLLSYTTPNQKVLARRFSRSLFNKMQTTLLLSFSFSLIFSWFVQREEKLISTLEVLEEWRVGEPYPILSFSTDSPENLDLSTLKLEEIRKAWLLSKPKEAPKSLNKNLINTYITWTNTFLFKRQDYQVNLSFPFPVEHLEVTIVNNNPQIPPIVYRSELPYEITELGDIKFTIGPNPPLDFSFNFSLDEAERLKLNLSFTSCEIEKTDILFIDEKPYRLFWKQRMTQNTESSFILETRENSPEENLDSDPEIRRLRQLSPPIQRLFT